MTGGRMLIGAMTLNLLRSRYECEESFTTLNVDIRNHQNLLDSMEQYVKGDLLEGANAYHCEKCNKKVPVISSPLILLHASCCPSKHLQL